MMNRLLIINVLLLLLLHDRRDETRALQHQLQQNAYRI